MCIRDSLLAALLPRMNRDDRKDLERQIPVYLGACERTVQAAAPLDASVPPMPAHPFGGLPPTVMRRVFERTRERDILPRFRALGLRVRA